MTNEKLNTLLYEKMRTEQEKYRSWLLGQPVGEVLNHAYEYTMREDILLSLESHNLTDEQAKALLRASCPLGDVFKEWENRETNHMDNIRDTIEARANIVLERRREITLQRVKNSERER